MATKIVLTEEMKTDILSAAVLGNVAFSNGLKRIPCFDKDLMNLLKKYDSWSDINHTMNMKLMTIWCENWDLANLNNN